MHGAWRRVFTMTYVLTLNDVKASNFFSSLPSLLKKSSESDTAYTFLFAKFNKEVFQ